MADNAKELLEALSKELHLSPEALQTSCERGGADELLKKAENSPKKTLDTGKKKL